MKPIQIPDRIDDPPHLLLWSLDEMAPPLVLLIIGVIMGTPMKLFFAGFILTYIYRRFRESKPDGYMLHLLYWYGVPFTRSRLMLNTFIRRLYP